MTMPMSDEQTIAALNSGLDSAPVPTGSWDDVLRGKARLRHRRRLAASVVAAVVAISASLIAVEAGSGSRHHHTGVSTVPGPAATPFAVVARATIGEPYAALTNGAGSVFAADWNSGRLLRYDATTLRLTGRLRVGSAQNSLLSLAFGDGSVWGLDFSSGELLRIDPDSLTILHRTRLDGQPSEVATGNGSVWVTVCCRSSHSADRQQLERVDPATGKVTGRTTLPGQGESLQLAVGTVIAVSGELGPIRLVNPRTMAVIRSMPNPGQAPASMAAADGQLYALTINNAVVRLDVDTGREPVVLSARGYDSDPNAVQDDHLLSGDGHTLWLSDDRQTIGLNPANGSITARAALTDVGYLNVSPVSVYVARNHDIERLSATP